MSQNKNCLLAHYGLTVSPPDAILFAAALGLLEPYLGQALQRLSTRSGDSIEKPSKVRVEHAQRAFSRLQRDLNFLHRSDVEIYVEGIGIKIQDLQNVCLHRATLPEPASEFLRDPYSAWTHLTATR